MLPRHIRFSVLLVLAAAALWLQWSCSRVAKRQSASEATCISFLGDVMHESTIGKRDGFRRRIDSFFVKNEEHSLECNLQKYIVTARILIDIHELDSARIFVDSALQQLEDEGTGGNNRGKHMGLLCMKGEVLYGMGRQSEAYNYYFRARIIANELQDSCVAHNNDYTLAMICYRQQQYHEAISNFRGAIWATRHCLHLDEFALQENLDNIGLCYTQLGIADSALLHYDSVIAVIGRVKTKILPITYNKALAVAYGNKGTLLQQMGQLDSAIALYMKSYDLNIQPNHENNDALVTHQKLASLWAQKGEWTRASDALIRIRAELDTIYHTSKEEAEWARLSAVLAEQQTNYAAAGLFYKKYIALKDTLNEQQKLLITTDVNRELDRKESEYQMQLLEKQNRLNAVYLFLAIGFLSMALIIALLIYRNYRRSRKNVRILSELNDRIVAQKGQLEEKNREKDHILHVVAHDLRNPIGGIMALSQRLMKSSEAEKDVRQLKMIEKTSENALELIGELLELNDNEDIKTREPVDINELVAQTVMLLQPMALAKQQKLLAVAAPQGVVMPLHAGKMQRLLNNLLSNAIKFTPRNGEITITNTIHNNHVLIEVSDTGVGIPAHLLPVIFTAFTTARRSGTEGEKPIGLGLSICKQIAEAHGGTITVVSTQGVGSTFSVVLPYSRQ